jgi:hypothetical protein
MVFKHELLDSLGISPENLDVFFADNTGFVTNGTDHVAIDTARNKIHAAIEHFSTIVVRPKSAVTYVSKLDKSVDRILNTYPNPFRNSTKISFKVESKANVIIEIYNINGQKVNILAHGIYSGGNYSVEWNGTNTIGNPVNEGIYFCRMIIDDKQSDVKKLILQR